MPGRSNTLYRRLQMRPLASALLLAGVIFAVLAAAMFLATSDTKRHRQDHHDVPMHALLQLLPEAGFEPEYEVQSSVFLQPRG